MAQAIRVGDGKSWGYVPASCRKHVSHFASLGLADVSNGSVLLKSDIGPIFWDLVNKELPSRPQMKIASAIESISEDSIVLKSGEKIILGNNGDVVNKFSDISLSATDQSSSVDMSTELIEDGQIVLTVWPDKEVIPAKAIITARRISLELATPGLKCKRSFILSEDASFLTVSFPSDGTESLMAMNQDNINSWLRAVGAKISGNSKFSVKCDPCGTFLVTDGKSGISYSGKLTSLPDTDGFELEKLLLERRLGSSGLGSILPTYQLRRA